MKIVNIIFALLFSSLLACQTEPEIPASPEVLFNSDIQPILAGKCGQQECHGGGGEESSLIGYENVIETGEVEPGNARQSELYRVVSNRSSEEMPPDPAAPLEDRDIKLIYVWIEQGAKNN